MRKLLKLKKWLTLSEAARHLSILVGEETSEADVLRLGLDGQLTLSAHLVNGASAYIGKVVPFADAKRKELVLLDGKAAKMIDGTVLPDERVIEWEEKVSRIFDVWDLTMFGAEAIDAEHHYQVLTDGPEVDLVSLEGAFLRQGDVYAKLMSRFDWQDEKRREEEAKRPLYDPRNFYPSGELPPDAVLVVRTAALQELEARLAEMEKPADETLQRRERTTLLVIIAALAKMAKVDLEKPSSAAVAIETQTALIGARVAARTIENHLKRIPDALESKAEG